MIKILAALVLGAGLTISPISYEESTEEVSSEIVETFESVTYTYEDEHGSLVITTISETEANLEITYEGETKSGVVLYSIEEGLLKVVNKETLESMEFVIGEDNKITWNEEEVEEPEIIYPCNVVLDISNKNYGDVLSDIEGGEIGDIVTLKVSPNILCKITNVTANGTQLLKNEDGNYTFALAEGDNVVRVEFAVDNEQLTYLADQIGNIKNGNWEDILTIENLFLCIYWIMSLLMSSGFFVTLIKNKKIKTKTTEEVANVIKEANELSIIETVNKILEKVLGDTFIKYLEKTDRIDETMRVLTRCFVLSQENTPEARLAIIKELTNLETNQKELTDKVKAMILEEISKNNLEVENKKKAIEALKTANQNINKPSNNGEDSYGQI